MNRVLLSGDERRLPVRAAGPPRRFPFPATRAERLERRTLLSVFTVTTAADDGPGSLRQAISNANGNAGADDIHFDIPGVAGVARTIRPLSPLPGDTGDLTIDGTSQPGYAGVPLIELDGSDTGPEANGLRLGARSAVRGLVISRFGGHGVLLSNLTAAVDRCYIGTDASGENPAGNGGDGVNIAGSPAQSGPGPTITGNVISGNGRDGLHAEAAYLQLYGNTVGLNASGTARLGNGGDGVWASGGVIWIRSGVPITGTPFKGRNVISGNAGHGVHVIGGYAVVLDSRVGTDASGNTAIGNGGHGVFLDHSTGKIGGAVSAHTSPTIGNLISGNRGHGVFVLGAPAKTFDATEIRANRIGTDVTGDPFNPTMGNGGHGVAVLDGARTTVGGEDDPAPNIIAFNGGNGVWVAGADNTSAGGGNGVRILRNSIFSNARLGIDLAASADTALATGVTLNDPRDADRGPNSLLNFPVIVSAARNGTGTGTVVHFTLDTPRSNPYRVEFFANSTADPSGFGEGQTYLGFTTVTAGTGPLSATASVAAAPVGTFVTATLTDPTRSITSEFSAAVPVTQIEPAEVPARYVYSDGIVPGKQALTELALQSGQAGSFVNVTGSPRGINGIVLDMAGAARPDLLSGADFAFRTRSAANPSTWVNYPARTSVVVSPGEGVGGADRVTLRFLDNFVINRWLETTVKANERTGLSQPDVFYFGSLVGETGDPASPLRVTALDLAAVKRAMSAPTPPPPGSPFDINRDGVVNAADLATVWEHLGDSLPPLEAPARFLLTAPASG